MAAAATTLLCAVRFWAGAGGSSKTTPTLRKGPRMVARSQGHSPSALNKGESQLVKRGLLVKPRKGVVQLTAKGLKVATRACGGVSLKPWGSARPRRRKRR